MTAARLFAWSDLHVDYPTNMQLILGLSEQDYVEDTLLVAGDLTGNLDKFATALTALKGKFRDVAFVPGNHDLWLSSDEPGDSLAKLQTIIELCESLEVRTQPFHLQGTSRNVRIEPILSWYLKPEEGQGSLFLPKPGEDPSLRIWSDNYRIRWPDMPAANTPAEHLLSLNAGGGVPPEDSMVVTFSHFLPRVELVFHDWEKFRRGGGTSGRDDHPEFNFTRVAGCRQLDQHLRSRRSRLHVYGHQHRNRDRTLQGVRYVSHCLGYPTEWRDRSTSPPRQQPLELELG